MINGSTMGAATQFILDSGATIHATGNVSLFRGRLIPIPEQEGSGILVANGDRLAVNGIGHVVMENFSVSNVLYVPGLTRNIISVSRLAKLDYSVEFNSCGCTIKDLRTDKTAGIAGLVKGLYYLDSLQIPLDRTPAVGP